MSMEGVILAVIVIIMAVLLSLQGATYGLEGRTVKAGICNLLSMVGIFGTLGVVFYFIVVKG